MQNGFQKSDGSHGRPQGGGETGICSPWKLELRSKN